MDVTSEASVRDAFETAVLAYGGMDIVVSNAGIAHSSPVDRMELADWERSFAVNSTGHFLVAREGMRVLKAQGLGGSVRLRGHQERDVARQGLLRVLRVQGRRGPARQGAGARRRARTASGPTS